MQKGFAPIITLALLAVVIISGYLFYQQARTSISPPISPSATITLPPTEKPTPTLQPTASPTPKPIVGKTVNVVLLIYNPRIESQGNKKLTDVKGWNSPDNLTGSFVKSVQTVSKGYVNYKIVKRIELDSYPVKADGFIYNDDSYLNCINSPTTCHQPDLANYQQMILDSHACDMRNNGQADELWIWGAPYFGYWESNLAGPNAFWYNSSPTTGTSCTKLLPIMGFNYERGEAEMFEDLAHRTESTMLKVYGSWQANEDHPWNRFSLLDVDKSGRGGCGNAHLAVNANSNQGYDRANQRTVSSSCNDFAYYPNLTGKIESINCNAWGCTSLGYLKWWFAHLPRTDGSTNGKLNNWWKYLVDPQSLVI